MSNKAIDKFREEIHSGEKPLPELRGDPLADTCQITSHEVPSGVDRRDFLIRSAIVGASAIMMGKTVSAAERTAKAVESIPVLNITRGLHVHRVAKGPIMTTFDELFKVGPGPSSSH